MWARRLGAALAVALFAAGCTGGGSEPPNGPEETTDVEVSPPSTEPTVEDAIDPALARRNPKKPERPPEMDGDDALAAIYTAEYFLDLYGYTVESGDTTLMKELSTEDCGFCTTTVEKVDELYAAGGWQVGGGLERGEGSVPEDYESREKLPVVVETAEATAVIVNREGRIVEDIDGREFLIEVVLVLVGHAWLVDTVNGESR